MTPIPGLQLVVDGSNIMKKGLSVNTEDYTPDGDYMGGVSSFLRMLKTYTQIINPSAIYVAFDYDKSRYRLNLYPEYKAGRNKNIDEAMKFRYSHSYDHQDILIKMLHYMGINVMVVPHVEADDIIANFVKQSKYTNVIVSTDKDFYQLINEKTWIFRPMKADQYQYIYPGNLETFINHPLEWTPYIKILCGDVSDNIKGVRGRLKDDGKYSPGIGETTAIKILDILGTKPSVIATNINKLDGIRGWKNWSNELVAFCTAKKKDGKFQGWQLNKKLMDLREGPKFEIGQYIKRGNYDLEIVMQLMEKHTLEKEVYNSVTGKMKKVQFPIFNKEDIEIFDLTII